LRHSGARPAHAASATHWPPMHVWGSPLTHWPLPSVQTGDDPLAMPNVLPLPLLALPVLPPVLPPLLVPLFPPFTRPPQAAIDNRTDARANRIAGLPRRRPPIGRSTPPQPWSHGPLERLRHPPSFLLRAASMPAIVALAIVPAAHGDESSRIAKTMRSGVHEITARRTVEYCRLRFAPPVASNHLGIACRPDRAVCHIRRMSTPELARCRHLR
jgi:hypothetical protein